MSDNQIDSFCGLWRPKQPPIIMGRWLAYMYDQLHNIHSSFLHLTLNLDDIFSRLLKERIICLNGSIDETVSASIVAQLLFLEADNPSKPINLYINSPGGSVTAGLAIYDTMTYIRSPVTTICVGQAASMGSLLLCGGSPGRRFSLPHSSIMVHQPSGGYSGQASDIAIHAKEILRVRQQLNGIYQRHLTRKHSLDDIEKLMERDYFMAAEEAKELGIVDEIMHKREPDAREGKRD
ncbi:MAG: hypothetical protein M1822_004634 [Bathelium mastoideum]|nr:MAG: hypothetical protein M1822_004634 [Bathelium mastoideum]